MSWYVILGIWLAVSAIVAPLVGYYFSDRRSRGREKSGKVHELHRGSQSDP